MIPKAERSDIRSDIGEIDDNLAACGAEMDRLLGVDQAEFMRRVTAPDHENHCPGIFINIMSEVRPLSTLFNSTSSLL